MTKSKARLLSNEEGAQEEATSAEGGDIEDEIDWFTLGLEDMQASPSQAQPQGQSKAQPQGQPQDQLQAPVQAFDHLDLILDKMDHLQRTT